MKRLSKIKIATETQINKPIYLYSNGDVECGKFRCKPNKLKKEFQEIFNELNKILIQLNSKDSDVSISDVSIYIKWSLELIYEEFIIKTKEDSISKETLEYLIIQNKINFMLDIIKIKFKKSAHRKWSSLRKKYDISDPNFPKKGYEIF